MARGRDVQTGEVPGGDGGRGAEAGQARALRPLRPGAEDLHGDEPRHGQPLHLHDDPGEEPQV